MNAVGAPINCNLKFRLYLYHITFNKKTARKTEAVFSYPTIYSRDFGVPAATLSRGGRVEPGGEIT